MIEGLVSVVVPVFNRPDMLRHAVGSAGAQHGGGPLQRGQQGLELVDGGPGALDELVGELAQQLRVLPRQHVRSALGLGQGSRSGFGCLLERPRGIHLPLAWRWLRL